MGTPCRWQFFKKAFKTAGYQFGVPICIDSFFLNFKECVLVCGYIKIGVYITPVLFIFVHVSAQSFHFQGCKRECDGVCCYDPVTVSNPQLILYTYNSSYNWIFHT